MRNALRHIVPLLCLAFPLSPFNAQADLTSDLQGIVDQYQTDHGVPGVTVSVWRGGSQIVDINSGVSNVATGELMNSGDYFKIGSITKSFTVTRVLQLADQGLLNLDDPISMYVPGTQNGTASLRQLANMTSGIFNYSEAPQFQAALGVNPQAVRTDSELVGYANANAPYYAPGAGPWNYSNTNTVLLGMAVQQVTGNTLQQEITEHIFTPLNMTHSLYPNPSADVPPDPYIHGYNEANGANDSDVSDALSSSVFSGAGAIYASAEDLAIWAEALGKGTLLSPEMQAERLSWVNAGSVESGPYYDLYGLGIGSIEGWIGHSGDQPGYQNLVLYDANGDQSIVITMNLGIYTFNYPTDMFLQMEPYLAVPEPSTWALGVFSLAFLGFVMLRRSARGLVDG